jgi:hypothetical protein
VEVDADFKPIGKSRVEIYEVDGKSRPQLLLEDSDPFLTVTDWR